MNNLNFIDYSNFLNQKVKAFQVLSNFEDRSIALDKHRAIITDNLAIDNNSLAIPIQVHSDNVQFIQKTGFFKDTDGLLTDKQDIILSLQTADCLPVFLFDKTILNYLIIIFIYSYPHNRSSLFLEYRLIRILSQSRICWENEQ